MGYAYGYIWKASGKSSGKSTLCSPKTMMPVAGIRSELANRHDSAVSVLETNRSGQRREEKGFFPGKHYTKVNTKLTFRWLGQPQEM